MERSIGTRLAAVVFCLAGLSACAFGDRQANLTYPPAASDGAMAADTTAPAAAGSRGQIFLATFSDLRPDKQLVGHVKNTYGMKTAKVLAQNDVRLWVEDAIAWELENAGYEVIRGTPDEAPGSGAVLSGDVIRVYCSAYFSYDGEVTVKATLTKNGDTLLDRAYTGQGSVGVNWAATGESYSQSLSLALRQAMIQLMSEINSQKL